jgi:site-specific DNA recombinase
MSKRVITYARTSTEDQSRHSLDQQQEAIQRYCDQNNYTIVQEFREHCSAKDFNRPVFKKLYQYAQKHKKSVDALFVLRFDRFGRNIEENFATIKKFRALGIEINSIEDPIDFSSPEHKILMSLFFSVSEVERDKISLRTRQTMQHAKEQGCWCGTPPFGYANYRDSNDKSTLMPNEDAKFVKLLFEEYAKGVYSVEDVRKKIAPLGFKKSKNACIAIIKNPVYLGKVVIQSADKKQSSVVEGLHPAIVEPDVFKTCQAIIQGHYRQPVLSTSSIDEELPLRGYILCPNCHKILTGSFSAGRGGKNRYGYIHCNPPCKVRYKSRDIHGHFERLLSEITLKDGFKQTYKEILKGTFKTSKEDSRLKKESLQRELSKLESRMEALHIKYIDDDIDKQSFELMNRKLLFRKEEITTEISKLSQFDKNFESHLHEGVSFLSDIDKVYQSASVGLKRKLISSLFPYKLYYNSYGFIAPKIDPVIALLIDMSQIKLLKLQGEMVGG